MHNAIGTIRLASQKRLRAASLAVCVLFAPSIAPLAGQAAVTGIAGTVADSLGMPLPGVQVAVRDEATGYEALTTTDRMGRYRLLGLPLGGPYVLRYRRVGFRAAERAGVALTMGARPTVDVRLYQAVVRLPDVVARREGVEGREARVGGSTRVNRAQIDALPVADRNFAGLAALSPLAGNQLALGGQRWTSTDFRIDGVQARNQLRAGEVNGGPAAISLEAVREFEVNTALFDVGQGRQGGGQVAAATRVGTNAVDARVFSAFRNEQLSGALDYQRRSRDTRAAQTVQAAASIGGPIVRDRAHYFVAYERQDSSEPLITGDVSTAQAEIAAGIARDSVRRTLDVLSRVYGADGSIPQLGRLARRPASQNLFARVDWQVGVRHRVTARLIASDWRSPLSGGVDQAVALREARSTFRSREIGAMASLTSRAPGGALNELQLSYSTGRRSLVPESPGIPRGFVQVRSTLPDGTTGNSTIQFGGNRLAPDDSREWQLQLIDRVAVERGRLLLTLGTDNALTGTRTLIAEAQTGLFVFPSIAALEARLPNRFSRTVPLGGASPIARQGVLETGLFAQGEWTLSSRLTLTTGLRWDGTVFLDAPRPDRAVDSVFAVQTGQAPRDLAQLQPRAQFVWRPTDGDVVRVGAGLFAAQLPYYAQHNQLLYTGTSLADLDLRGGAVPSPDFPGFRAGTAPIPGLVPGSAPPPAFVNVSGAVRAPRTLKASAAWERRVGVVVATTGVQLSRTRDNYHYVDRNLRDAPSFRLMAEDGRGVWVPAASIAPATGVTDVRLASRQPGYARVLALESGARAEAIALTGELAIAPRRGTNVSVGYAWARARDNSTYGCCLARTATTFTPIVDDPRNLAQAWAASDFDARHRIVGTVGFTAPLGVTFSARYLGTSGRPFSLVVDGDINGDEANGNDRAFLFDPDDPSTPSDIAASMRRLLANSDNVARHYIRSHVGAVAGRNTIYTPWTHRVDARFARRFSWPSSRTIRGAELLVDVFNLGNLLNRRWGAQYLLPGGISSQNPVVNRVPLLRVVGFDAAAGQYRYTVNESAGVLPRGGDPYQLQAGLRLTY